MKLIRVRALSMATKNGPLGSVFYSVTELGSDSGNVLSLRTLLALRNSELNFLTFSQGFEA